MVSLTQGQRSKIKIRGSQSKETKWKEIIRAEVIQNKADWREKITKVGFLK